MDSRLRRSPPDRASAVPYGQAGENAMRFPRLAHRSAAAHKLHSTPQQDRMNLISGKRRNQQPATDLSLFLPGSCPNYRDRRSRPARRPARKLAEQRLRRLARLQREHDPGLHQEHQAIRVPELLERGLHRECDHQRDRGRHKIRGAAPMATARSYVGGVVVGGSRAPVSLCASALTGSVWIRGPSWDGLWILSGLPLAALFTILTICGVPSIWIFGGSFILLQTGHSLSPMALAWGHGGFRRVMLQSPAKYLWLPLAALIGSTAAGYVAGELWPQPRFNPITFKISLNSAWNPLWGMAAAYFLWNIYHFGKQNFGVMSIYRRNAGGYAPQQRRLDLIYCCVMATGVLSLPVVYMAARAVGGYFSYGEILCAYALIGLAGITVMLLRERRHGFCLPRAALILGNGVAMTAAPWWGMGAIALVNCNHWLTAIGLADHVWSKRHTAYLFTLVVVLLGVALFCLLFVDLKHLTISSQFAATAIGFRLGLGAVHFMYDRWVWKLSDSQVRATIGRDLLRRPKTEASELHAPLML